MEFYEKFPNYDGDVRALDDQVQIVQQELIRRIQKIPLDGGFRVLDARTNPTSVTRCVIPSQRGIDGL